MSSVVEKITELMRGFGLSAVYGEVRELNGVYIVPVAMSFHAFGAGESAGDGEGTGGAGVAASVPFGAYVRDIRGLRFEPNLVTLLAVATPLVWVSGRILKNLSKAKRKRR